MSGMPSVGSDHRLSLGEPLAGAGVAPEAAASVEQLGAVRPDVGGEAAFVPDGVLEDVVQAGQHRHISQVDSGPDASRTGRVLDLCLGDSGAVQPGVDVRLLKVAVGLSDPGDEHVVAGQRPEGVEEVPHQLPVDRVVEGKAPVEPEFLLGCGQGKRVPLAPEAKSVVG